MTPYEEFLWNWWVPLATAVATFLAVLAALFLNWFCARFFPPVLVLELVDRRGAPPVSAFGIFTIEGQQRTFQSVSRWYHVRVENKRRMSRATETQVCLVAVAMPNAAGTYITQSTGAIPLKVRHEGVVQRIIRPPVEWDFCSVIKEVPPNGSPVFELQTVVAPSDIIVRQSAPFRMVLTLQARSIEVDSNLLRLKLVWDGQWADDTGQMASHARSSFERRSGGNRVAIVPFCSPLPLLSG